MRRRMRRNSRWMIGTRYLGSSINDRVDHLGVHLRPLNQCAPEKCPWMCVSYVHFSAYCT